MSDVMTQAIIGMPYELAMSDELSRLQFHSRAQELLADYAALEAELARLRAGQEPVAYQCREIGEGDWADCDKKWFDYCERSPLHDTRKLYTTPQPSAVPDGWRELLQKVAEYAPPYGTIVAMTSQMALGSKARRLLAAAPSTSATVQGDARVPDAECRRLLFAFGLECNTIGLLGAAENLHKGMKAATSAAARKGEV